MKNHFSTLTFILFLSTASGIFAQNDKLAVGVQYHSNSMGLSIKYNLDSKSSIQGIFNPVSVGDFSNNYFGGRYNYYFETGEFGNLKPYVFGGLGIVTYTYRYSNTQGAAFNDETRSFLGYSLGAGLQGRLTENLELSGDLGFGRLNVSSGSGSSGITLGFGLHYYLN
jgi:opacity protein-like surface antigen